MIENYHVELFPFFLFLFTFILMDLCQDQHQSPTVHSRRVCREKGRGCGFRHYWYVTGDRWPVTPDPWNLTPDTWHLTVDNWFLKINLILLLLSLQVVSFSVSRMPDLFISWLKIMKKRSSNWLCLWVLRSVFPKLY